MAVFCILILALFDLYVHNWDMGGQLGAAACHCVRHTAHPGCAMHMSNLQRPVISVMPFELGK